MQARSYLPTPDWHTEALCAGIPDDTVWFPEGGHSTRPAKALCRRCSVSGPCLRDALIYDERFGVFGGTTPHERAQIRRYRATQRRGTTT